MIKKKIIICLIIFMSFISIFLLIFYFNKENSQKNILDEEKQHYNELYIRMKLYYKIYFNELSVSDSLKNKPLKITLNKLKSRFPIDEFKNYETGEICDKEKSYAIRTIKNNENVIDVYYKCGDKTNY